ncbi:hypothetical protein F5Y17DRAFT_84035 [Xylariaceae sp. FL0594]|nr:hypothetical protein F5Y17DRAFT_84035 [Xylariaceae sp. FL0594]
MPMSSQFPSIQSFYSRDVPYHGQRNDSGLNSMSDGFTISEIEAVTKPLSRPFRPVRDYESCDIAELQTGPHDYKISGRLVNFSSTIASNEDSAGNATGDYHFLVICDRTAALAIKLHCNADEYRPVLGQRITVWATSISAGNQAEIGHIPYCSVATTIYPGRDGATHIIFHADEPLSEEDRSLRVPLEVDSENRDQLPGLMTLKSFTTSGYELGEGKIVVCVRSIGPRRTVFSKKKERACHLVEIGIYDHTATCILTLWGDMIASAKAWTPNETVLLISQPSARLITRQGSATVNVTIGYSSMVNVDPDLPDARWLRTKIQEMARKESISIPFPTNTWDVEAAIHGPGRTLYTLAEVEDRVRNQGVGKSFTGKLSVCVFEMKLMDHWRKATMFCVECCGIPLYANKPSGTCKNCGSRQALSLNPRIIGSFLDESGKIAGSKLVWNDDAWTQFLFGTSDMECSSGQGQATFLGKSWEHIAEVNSNELRDMEANFLYSRVTLTFGWSGELGRLCVLGVEW